MLICKPFTGEWGWELMRWQAHCRHVSRRHKQSLVYCMEGHEYLYQDFATEIIPVKVTGGKPDCWGRSGDYKIQPDVDLIHSVLTKGTEVLEPTKNECAGRRIQQEFIRFGKSNPKIELILCHARNTQHERRNWPLDKWNQLVSILKISVSPIHIYSIGTKKESFYIQGSKDFRDIPLKDLADIMNVAQLAIGPSSGPMHFASLCGCPHVVWTDNKRWNLGSQKGTNRQRYESIWNPLKTPVKILDNCDCNPSGEEVKRVVINEIVKEL